MPNVYYILLAAKSGEVHKLSVEDATKRVANGDYAATAGEVELFASRDDAGAKAIALRETNPDQHYLVEGPMPKDRLDWRARERARLNDGSHTKLTPELARHCLPEHFAHVAKGDPRSLAYTKNEADGVRDIQKRMNVSAYLEAYAKHLDSGTRRALQELHQNMASAADLLIARTAEEIVHVYTNHIDEGGVGISCMRHDVDSYCGSEHPVSPYGDSDLAVAYVKDRRGRTTARAVIWPAKQCYSRMYGTDTSTPELQRLMIAAGYKPSRGYYGHTSNDSQHSLVGARIRAIPDANDRTRFIVPYLDEGNVGVIDDASEWITITNQAIPGSRTLSIKETAGAARVRGGPVCPSCRCEMVSSSLTPAYSTYPASETAISQHCGHCVGSATFVCSGTGQRFNRNSVPRVAAQERTYARGWAEANMPMCGCCGGFTSADNLLPFRVGLAPDLTKVCNSCAVGTAFWDDEAEVLTHNFLRVSDLDVRARKRIAWGNANRLIDRGYSILSARAAAHPDWAEAHSLALEEADGAEVCMCRINKMTGKPVISDGRVLTQPSILRTLGLYAVRGCKVVRYTPEIEAMVPHVGNWVRVDGAWAFDEAVGFKGRVISTSEYLPDTGHAFVVTLTDGRVAYSTMDQLTLLSESEVENISVTVSPPLSIGERVMFVHHASPRFGQRGVISAVEDTIFVVQLDGGVIRRANGSRIQRVGQAEPALPMDLPVPEQPSNVRHSAPREWADGDRVRLLPNCIDVSIPLDQADKEGVLRISGRSQPMTLNMDNGRSWCVRSEMLELVEAVAEQGV